MALYSFVTSGVIATSLTAAALSLSTANLGAIRSLAAGDTDNFASKPSMNLHVSVQTLEGPKLHTSSSNNFVLDIICHY